MSPPRHTNLKTASPRSTDTLQGEVQLETTSLKELESRQRRLHLLHNPISAAIILACGLLATASAWFFATSALEERTQERFDNRADEIQHAIRDRMIVYEQVLWGGVGLFNASEAVNRDEWRAYVETTDIGQLWPGIQGVGFSVPLAPDEVDAHIADVRAEGFPEYTILPAGERPEYSAIVFLEPFDWRNQRAFGFDMWSNEMRRAAMTRARDTGEASTSGVITLVQETKEDVQRGFLTYVPVYEPGAPLETLGQRRAAFRGWVYSPFRMGDLMTAAHNLEESGVNYELFDGDAIVEEVLLYDSNAVFDGDAHTDDALFHRATIDLQGRTWTILFHADESFASADEKNQPMIIAGIGLAVDLLLFYVLTALMSLNKRAASLAREQTDALFERQKGLEEALTHNERLLAIINGSTDFIGYADTSGQVEFSNDSFQALLRKDSAPGGPSRISEIHPDWANELILKEGIPATLEHGSWRGETAILTHDGREVPVDQLILAHPDPNGVVTHTSTVMRDMSRQRAMEAKLRRSNEELLQFAFVASHDLQEPLRQLMTFSELLQETHGDALTGSGQKYLGYIRSSASRMRQLINDLLTYSRVSQESVRPSLCSAGDALMLVISQLGDEQRACVSSTPLPDLVFVAHQLSQLLQNLITNALKYQPKDQTPEVHLSAARARSGWEFSVRDNGIGVEERFHERIFEPFKRLHNRKTYAGTGVGLSICKQIVERRGGRIWVGDAPDGGSVFYFSVPDSVPRALDEAT